MKESKRIYIYASDVSELTGKCIRTAYKILKKIRIELNKKPEQFITFEEFYTYMGTTFTNKVPNKTDTAPKS